MDDFAVAHRMLDLLTPYRRYVEGGACASQRCPQCGDIHGKKIAARIARGEPVQFLLPGFPGKSPNPRKVLAATPDMAEYLSLSFLADLCARIRQVYRPGAVMVICSDGRAFSDVVGIRDEDVSTYQRELHQMMRHIAPAELQMYNLDGEFVGLSHDEVRQQLMATHGEDLERIKDSVAQGGEPLSLYQGITRFLLEDADAGSRELSRAALQRDCRARAYEVIRRSRAWTELVGQRFPEAVRLSIHPQACASEKLGIRMLEATDNWLTPWHGVAVDVGGRFLLMKRHQAESLDVRLVYRDGRPWHYALNDPAHLPEFVRRSLSDQVIDPTPGRR